MVYVFHSQAVLKDTGKPHGTPANDLTPKSKPGVKISSPKPLK